MNMSKFFKQIKRISLISLSLTVILSSFVFGVPTAAATDSSIWNGSDLDADFEGSGTENDPYQINSAAELYGFAKKYCGEGPIASEGKYFELNTDVYLNDVSSSDWMNKSNKPHEWAFFNTWTINGNAQGFRGNFNGNGHTVYGMYYENPNDWAAIMGLIPFASGNAVITNVNIKNAYVHSSSYAGSLGSIVGVINKDGGKTASNVTITKCVADDTNDFSGLTNAFAGGIVGVVRESAVTVKYCGSAVKFNSNSKPAGQGGGILGKNSGCGMTGLSITNSYSVASFSMGIPDALYETFTDDAEPLFSCNNWPSQIVYVKSSKLMMGADALTYMGDLDWNVWQANNSAFPTIKGSTSYVKPVSDGIDVWDGTTAVTYDGGTGTVNDPYLVSTPEQLRKVILTPLTGESGEYYLLTNDIYINDVSDYANWYNKAPANNWRKNELFTKSFTGHIDGNGYAVYGVYHSEDNNVYWGNMNRYAGLITNIGTGSSITNLHIRKSFVCSEYAGALIGSIGGTAGNADGTVTISGCSADDTVSVHGLYTGGLIGCAQATLTVDNCYSSASLAGDSAKGGIYGNAWAGNANHTIKNSYSYGAYPVAMTANNASAKLPAEGKRVYENVYSFYTDYEQENWENIISVSDYSEMTALDLPYWYGTEKKLLVNRGKATFDVSGDGSETPDSKDLAALRMAFLSSDSFNAVHDCNDDGEYNILDLIHLKKVIAGFFA